MQLSPEICTCDLNDKSVGYQKDSEQSSYLKAYLRTQKNAKGPLAEYFLFLYGIMETFI